MSVETVEEIRARWNTPPTSGGVARVIGQPSPEGDTRASAALNPDAPDSSKRDQSLPEDVKTLTVNPETGQPVDTGDTQDKYTDMDMAALRDEADARNEGRGDDDKISKGGSADDLRARLREDDLLNGGDAGSGD